MPNITISLNEELLKLGSKYAERHQTSLNVLIRKLLVEKVRLQSDAWLEECFTLMDRAGANSKGRRWRREDLYNG